jgi:hypothetical protein
MTFEVTDILASHLTMMVFVYGSVGLLLANLTGMLALGRLDKKARARPRPALARVT